LKKPRNGMRIGNPVWALISPKTIFEGIESLRTRPLIHRLRDRDAMSVGFWRIDFPTGLFIECRMNSSTSSWLFTPHGTTGSGTNVYEGLAILRGAKESWTNMSSAAALNYGREVRGLKRQVIRC